MTNHGYHDDDGDDDDGDYDDGYVWSRGPVEVKVISSTDRALGPLKFILKNLPHTKPLVQFNYMGL
jgi:hypothetical protein